MIISNDSFVDRMLKQSFNKDRLSHCYIFNSFNRQEMEFTSKNFAKALLCKEHDLYCDECSICRRVNNETHTNVYILKPKNDKILKEQVIALQDELNKSTPEDGPRVYIIESVHKLNESSSNSLLKILEDPFNENYAILTTNKVEDILDTIRSRSQLLNIKNSTFGKADEFIDTLEIEPKYVSILNKLPYTIDQFKHINNFISLNDLVLITEKYVALTSKSVKTSYLYFIESFNSFISELNNSDNFLVIEAGLLLVKEYYRSILKCIYSDEENIYFNSVNLDDLTIEKISNNIEQIMIFIKNKGNYTSKPIQLTKLLINIKGRDQFE